MAAGDYVQSSINWSYTPPDTLTIPFDNPNVAGNVIIVVCVNGSFAGDPAITDTNGNVYTLLASQGNIGIGNYYVKVFWCNNCVAGANIVTQVSTGGQRSIAVFEYEGPLSVVDDSSTSAIGGTSVSTAVTLGNANDLLFAVTAAEFNAATFSLTPSTGWNLREAPQYATVFSYSIYDQIYGLSGAYNLQSTSSLSSPLILVLIGLTVALSISCDDPPDGVLGIAYTHTFPASGGVHPYTFAITAGALPDGLTLDTATGEVSGTPTVPDTFPFTIQVTDNDSNTADVNCSITVVGTIAINCDNPPQGEIGVAYTHTFPVVGGVSPFTFSITSGTLPPGLVLDTSTGVVSGNPITAGIFPFTIQVTDSAADTADVDCSIGIGGLDVVCNNPPDGAIQQPYGHTFPATGGTPPYTFSISAGALPDGITLDSTTGVASGTPTVAGTFTFTIQVVDALGSTAHVTCSITISPHIDGVLVHYWEEVPEGIEPRILMGTPRGLFVAVDSSGSDNGFDLRATIRTPNFDMGDPRVLKLFMDTMTDNVATGGIGVTAGFNNFDVTFGIGSMAQQTREQTLLQISNLNPNGLVLYRNIGLEYVFGTGSLLYEAEPSYYLQPFTSKFYTTQLLSSGIVGWKQLRYLRFAMISVTDVQFQILNDDGVLVANIAVPNTQGILRNGFIQIPNACKGRMLRYTASSDSEFVLFVEDTYVRIKKWGGPQFAEVRPFLQ
jgi:hypothetical protein